jgi:hypothetical protein
MKLKRNLAFAFFLLAGVILGALAATVTSDLPMLGWLSFGQTVGIPIDSPMVLDLAMMRIAFGCEIGINVAQIFTVTAALLVYKRVAQKL